MSQQLNLKLVNKTNPEMSLDLGYWSTSISRQIYSNFNEEVFPYSENAVRLDISTFKSYIKTLDEGIKEFKGYLYRAMKRKRENTDLLLKAQTEIVVKDIRNEIVECEHSIESWREEIDKWFSVWQKLNFILEVIENNESEWELEYRNS